MKTENTNNVQKDEIKDINKHKLINKILKISCLSLAVMTAVLDLVYALGIFKISKYILVFAFLITGIMEMAYVCTSQIDDEKKLVKAFLIGLFTATIIPVMFLSL